MNTTYCIKLFCLALCSTFAVPLSARAVGGFEMLFLYRNTQDGKTYQGSCPFYNADYSASEDCPVQHRTPDGQMYHHGHSVERFGNLYARNPDDGHNDLVTAQKSDWAWDAFYLVGQVANVYRFSSSTFLSNCYAHATDAPTPMPADGWTAWTLSSSQCELTSSKKSFKYDGQDHCIVIASIQSYYEDGCEVTSTSEKNASSGVYVMNYFGMGHEGDPTGAAIRKKK
jgi:hypothetical protein